MAYAVSLYLYLILFPFFFFLPFCDVTNLSNLGRVRVNVDKGHSSQVKCSFHPSL